MDLDPRSCWRAVKSRDRRFDGVFFTTVLTTGVYCRPICPVPAPLRKNVRFVGSAAAAEEAGFRPCRRCRPETAPHTPAWAGSCATVERALRLIGAGALDRDDVDALAARLGVGSRHLRRLFAAHVGASPLSVARTRRVHFARQLIDGSDLPMSQVAHAAGFRSVRQFNDGIRTSFGKPPRDLRRAARRGVTPNGVIHLALAYRPPLDWNGLLSFLALRAIPGVEDVSEGVYRRTVVLGGKAAQIAARHDPDRARVLVEVEAAGPEQLLAVVDRARAIFDLDAAPRQIAEALSADPVVGPHLGERPGLRVPGCWDPFELAVRAVLGQQVSVRGASTLAGRLVGRFGKPLACARGPLTHLFPEPVVLAGADIASIGMPRARGDAIATLARAVAEGRLRFDATHGGDGPALEALRELPGIGDWTAQYVAMRALRDPDAFPAGDLVLRRALADDGDRPPSSAQVRHRAQAWRPWRSYAALALWPASS